MRQFSNKLRLRTVFDRLQRILDAPILHGLKRIASQVGALPEGKVGSAFAQPTLKLTRQFAFRLLTDRTHLRSKPRCVILRHAEFSFKTLLFLRKTLSHISAFIHQF